MANKYGGKKPGKKHFKKKIQEFEGSGFGEYQESTGGGKPFEAGNTNTRTTQENGKIRKAENDTMQPRTGDGKFTYKSVNGQSIDPKYGPSRGKTVNPLLTGGENGVYIKEETYNHDVYSNGKLIHKKGEKIEKSSDNVEKQFSEEHGEFWDKWKDKWYRKSGKVITEDLSTQVAAEAIWETAKRRYDVDAGEFEGESGLFSTKSGKKSKSEKAAVEKVKASGQEQGVIDENTGGIELKDKVKKAAIEKFVADKSEPAKEEPVQEEEQVEETKVFGSGKFTQKEADDVLNQIKSELGDGFDPDFWTDEQLEDFMNSIENEKKD